MLKYTLIILLIIFLVNPATAKFVCGEVHSSDEVTPSWYDVKIYLAQNKTLNSDCKVSPSNNKYCCDIEIIEDKFKYEWQSGDVFTSEITDKNSGYLASRKNTTLTLEGYDISPTLSLEQAIKIIYPENKFVISKEKPNILVKLSSACSEFGTIKNNIKEKICDDCNSTYNLNPEFGEINLSFYAICNDQEFILKEKLAFIENLNFEKNYFSFSNKIKEKSQGIIKLSGQFSQPITNAQIKEYIPSNWKILSISNKGKIEKSTQDYSVISWNISGTNFQLNYKVKAPESSIFSDEYKFFTEIENNQVANDKINVYGYIPITLGNKPKGSGSPYKYEPTNFSKTTSKLALISKNKEQNLIVALYSKTPKEREALSLIEFANKEILNKSLKYIKSYFIESTLNQKERDRFEFEYTIEKEKLLSMGCKKIIFFAEYNNSFFQIKENSIIEENGQLKYKFISTKKINKIFIFAEKNNLSLKDRLTNLIENQIISLIRISKKIYKQFLPFN